MRDDFDALVAERFAVLIDVPVPDTWSRVESKLLDPTTSLFTEAEATVIDLEEYTLTGAHRNRRRVIGALVGVAAAATLIGALVVVNGRDDTDQLPPVDSTPATVPATTTPAPTLPTPTTAPIDSSQSTLPATTIDSVSAALPAMWPQSSIDEVRQAQQLADAGDPAFTWQVDPLLTSLGTDRLSIEPELELWNYLRSPGTAIVDRFVRDELGWEEFLFYDTLDVPDGLRNLLYLRCAPGETNPLYPIAWDGDQEASGGHRCAPTIDELRYEAVVLDLARPDRQDQDGIVVVSQPRERSFEQADPRVVEADATAHLEDFLQARLDGEGAEGYVEIFYLFGEEGEDPLLYATTTGAPYERYEIERVGEPSWPYGDMDFRVRLSADDGATVVEQMIHRSVGNSFRLSGDSTTENGQPLP